MLTIIHHQVQTETMKYQSTFIKMAIIKRQVLVKFGEIGALMLSAGGNVKWCSCFGKTVCQFPKILHMEVLCDSNSSTPRHTQK